MPEALPDAGTADSDASAAELPALTGPPTVVPAEPTSPEPGAPVLVPPDQSPPPASGGAIEVSVRPSVKQGPRDELVRSAEAVTVVKLDVAKRRGQDMGDVLSRTAGVMLMRSGGLGSYARFSMNGLYDDQIRFFLDGVPLEYSGFTQGIANMPVNLFEQVVVYRGVLPVRLGADALGGAINLITDDKYETGADGSYQRSSYGTHRATLSATYRHEPTGLVVRGRGFFDIARNNYPVDNVTVTNSVGRPDLITAERFHDHYRAYGVSLEAGVVDKKWAKKLLVRGFHGDLDADLQSNRIMSIPYGEVTYGDRSSGVTARYENTFADKFTVEAVANHTRRRIDLLDDPDWVWNWRGQRVLPRAPTNGEIDTLNHDQSLWDKSAFGRVYAEYAVTPAHAVRASLTPTFTSRRGDERLQADPNSVDPLTAKRDLFTLVSGLEYESNFFEKPGRHSARAPTADDYDLRNALFVKAYTFKVDSEDALPGGGFRNVDQNRQNWGVGDALRYTITPYLQAKASYELTVRMPRPDEIFGNGVLVLASLELQPERSHNVNLGPHLEIRKTPIGDVAADINFFVRSSKDLIFLLGGDRFLAYQNVANARSLGLEGMVEYTSPGRWVGSSGGATWVDQRNTSKGGAFLLTEGDRIPSRPYLTAFWAGNLHFEKLFLPRDALEPYYYGRYVHDFFTGWESLGTPATRSVIPTQITHALGISYYVTMRRGRVAASGEIQNLTDENVFDLYGVQRPGRVYLIKISGDI